MKAILLMALFLPLGGCAFQDRPTAPASQPGKRTALALGYQRFVPMAQHAGGPAVLDFALDTKTGQLCRTWPWEVTDTKPGSRAEGLNNLPECFTLYTQYPDRSETAQSKSLDEEIMDAVKKAKEKPSSAPKTWDGLKRSAAESHQAQPQR